MDDQPTPRPTDPPTVPPSDVDGASCDRPDMERLRAADPAAGAHPDLAAVRAEVERLLGEDPSFRRPEDDFQRDGDATAEAGGAAQVLPLRRRRRWLPVAAAVAALAVVGAGGFSLGRAQPERPRPAIAVGPGVAADSEAADARLLGSDGRTVFTSAGLGDEPGNARAWAYDAAAVFSAETVARVAQALGVAGDPVPEWGAWTVGPQDGSGPSVQLQPDGTASLSYQDPTRDPWACEVTDPGATSSDGGAASQPAGPEEPAVEPVAAEPGDSGGTVALADGGLVGEAPVDPTFVAVACDQEAGDVPSDAEAVRLATDLLQRLGLDPAGFDLIAEAWEDSRAAYVTAYQVVDGQETGQSWSFTVVGDAVQSAYGPMAPLVDLGEYPVVGADTAVGRLSDPRFGSGWSGAMPLLRAADGSTTEGSAAQEDSSADQSTAVAPEEDGTAPATARPGDPVPWAVAQVTITQARLSLGWVQAADGGVLLVPFYELTGDDESVWIVLAVQDSALDTSPLG